MDEDGTAVRHCYCNTTSTELYMLVCKTCKKRFHSSCLKSGPPSSLAGDVYFRFICQNCSPSGEEVVERMKLQWTLVVILTLFNLQVQGEGKCGFFRWREDICKFIDQNWAVFFGADRKKAATWHHTIAGILSACCNRYFISGSEQLHEKGWWALKDARLPTVEDLETIASIGRNARKTKKQTENVLPVVEGPRHKQQNIVEAALALKAKRTAVDVSESSSKSKKAKPAKLQLKIRLSKDNGTYVTETAGSSSSSSSASAPVIKAELAAVCESENANTERFEFTDSSLSSSGNSQEKSEVSVSGESNDITQWMKQEASSDSMDLNLDISKNSHRVPFSKELDFSISDTTNEGIIKEEEDEQDSKPASEPLANAPVRVGKQIKKNNAIMQHMDTARKRKAVTNEEIIPKVEPPELNFVPLNVYEEHQLLTRLKILYPHHENNVEFRNLYRKLIVRQLKRKNNIPVFNIDKFVYNLCGRQIHMDTESSETNAVNGSQEILDRYRNPYRPNDSSLYRTSFFARLMGFDDDNRGPFVSPYTSRTLKPFIFRDYKTMPLKLKLLQEIINYHHRNDPSWKPPRRYPIDYCYVRPQHIPAVNALCCEFFWPSIDMSECLQYPDFSCVALYKKVVIGFAFMVPDAKYDEAYISFILTHPEWRRAGIAKFMLYHLIQTCMGKDITLHVSATSPAIFLYQKFGFKAEEFILDFYDKYLPVDSKECRHALFLRLSR